MKRSSQMVSNCSTKAESLNDFENAAILKHGVIPRIEEELKQESDPDFDSPSWAYKQAYQLGYKRGLTKLLKYAILLPSKE